ncbi:hypothetical protein DENIS_3533 [Desulfonema ishimotonii]|uniref:Uncharacterized protein n=1 Tax=Desulfonema ishimotonii TaxID=45657 RepID=A0A401G019_9BACT|nr:hypothetical protein [Desulfonema ishimotonii]GBC62561.1 hypothetical protein DENIS_3533 [Desulfonema ishimotonii]
MYPQDHKSLINFRASLLLSMQGALLGEVTPELRGVTVGWTEDIIQGIFYYDCKITDDISDIVEEIETLIISGFPDYRINFKAVQNNESRLPEGLLEWVYLRAE